MSNGDAAIQPLGKGQFNWMLSLYSLLIHGTMENQFSGGYYAELERICTGFHSFSRRMYCAWGE